jgi:UDP-glucoronosyl and UDP-glucosyl transferase
LISGGLLGVQEAITHAVPILFVPFLNNQVKVAEQVRKNGHGLIVNFDDLTKETFTKAILELTMNTAFKEQAAGASHLFTDNSVKPMEEAMFRMEYVVRNNGAKHLKSPSVNFSLSKYLNYDVGIFFFALFTASFLFWVYVIKIAIQKYQGREQRGKFKYY